jgi:hypothetical protein
MHARASELQPAARPAICGCESPICPAQHPARSRSTASSAPGASELSWLAARRARIGFTATLVRQRVVRRHPRHA